MTGISLPLRVTSKGLAREEQEKKSIDDILSLILMTPRFNTPSDAKFGFVFNNLRFEMFNENEGVVFDSGETDSMDGVLGLYDKKISGSSLPLFKQHLVLAKECIAKQYHIVKIEHPVFTAKLSVF